MFIKQSIESLKHIIEKRGLLVSPAHTQAIKNAYYPKNVKQLKSFLIGSVSKFLL